MSKVLLGFNIDHIATLRNVRKTVYPDPIHAAFIAEQSGVDSITVHLREDRRHILDRDVRLLRKTIQTAMNLEIAATEEMVSFACLLKPNYCCLVPENRQELTTEGGLDVIRLSKKNLCNFVSRLSDSGIKVSLFINPDEEQIKASYAMGVSCIELHTGVYADSIDMSIRELEYKRIKKAMQLAKNYGLQVNAGHGLNYHNVQYIAALPYIRELNIGHAIVCRSVFCGLHRAIKDMKLLLQSARSIPV